MEQSLEQTCKGNLLVCAEKYATRKKVKLTTLGRLVANDSPFFARLQDDSKNFTVRKYDEVIGWFASNWPADLAWPAAVPYPNEQNTPLPDSTADRAPGSSLNPIPDTAASPPSDAGHGSAGEAERDISSSFSDHPQSSAPAGVEPVS